LTDNLLAILLAFWVLLVIAALIFLAVTGIRLWRTVKRTKGLVEAPIAELSASAHEAHDRITVLEEKQRDMAVAGEELSAQIAGAATLGKHAGDIAKTLRFPVRFLAGL